MKKTVFLSAIFAVMVPAMASAETYMSEATLVYPSSEMVSMAPGVVDLTWDNQKIKLVDPTLNDWDEEVVMVPVYFDEEEQGEVSAALLTSLGDDGDIYLLEVALYELDTLFDAEPGMIINVNLPAGIVVNKDGEVNPAQTISFAITPAFLDYTVTPESGTLQKPDAFVKVSFDGNELKYLGGDVTVYSYEPSYQAITLEYGKEVTVKDNKEMTIDLNSIPNGHEVEMVIPEGMFSLTVDGVEYITPDIWVMYDIDGTVSVKTLATDKGQKGIYNLNGIRVDSTRMGKGIFIIDGKKVVK